MKISKPTSGFELPAQSEMQSPRNRSSGNTTVNSSKYTPTQTNNSLARVGKSILQTDSSAAFDTPNKT